MDFGDILRIFGFLLIPIVLKAVKQSKSISKKYTPGNSSETYDSKRITKEPELTMTDDHSALAPNVEYKKEIKPKINAREVYLQPGNTSKSVEKTLNKTRNSNKKRATFDDYDIRDVITDSDIGSNELNLRFNRSELVRGILMSEVLSKPKSLRK